MKNNSQGKVRNLPPQKQAKPHPPIEWDRTLFEKSYVISCIWAWISRIQLSPTVKIPIPRFLSTRDP